MVLPRAKGTVRAPGQGRWKKKAPLARKGGRKRSWSKVRATASVHRRRPWNGELCRFVQPAASWYARARYEARRSRPNGRLRQRSAPNKTTNFARLPSPRKPLVRALSLSSASCCLAPRARARARARVRAQRYRDDTFCPENTDASLPPCCPSSFEFLAPAATRIRTLLGFLAREFSTEILLYGMLVHGHPAHGVLSRVTLGEADLFCTEYCDSGV